MKFSACSLFLVALVLGVASVQPSPAQTFKRVLVKGGATLAQIAPGGASVWARASNGQPYIFKVNKFVLANSISLTQLAVGGGNAVQADAVWGLDSSGRIFSASKSGTSYVFNQMPGVLDFIAVGPGYQDSCHPYEVWGLNAGSEIFRFNFCRNSFDQVPGFLCQVQVGGGDILGTECGPNIFRFNFSTGVFDPMGTPFVAFPELTLGPHGVWGIDSSTSRVWEKDDSGGWLPLAGTLTQIQAGGNGVWGIGSSQTIFRFEASTINPVQIPGALVSISVGSGGGVWGINSSGQPMAFSTL